MIDTASFGQDSNQDLKGLTISTDSGRSRKSKKNRSQRKNSIALKTHIQRVKRPNLNKRLSPLRSLLIEDLPNQYNEDT